MNPYRKLTETEYRELIPCAGSPDAKFLHAVDDSGIPCDRSDGKLFRKAPIMRVGNDLYFCAKGRGGNYEYEVPKDEYCFVDEGATGSINVNMSLMDYKMRGAYHDAREYALKLECAAFEVVEDVPMFLDTISLQKSPDLDGIFANVPWSGHVAAVSVPKPAVDAPKKPKKQPVKRVSKRKPAKRTRNDDSKTVSGWSGSYFAAIAGC